MTAIVFVLIVLLLGVASALGRTPDSRDADFSVGALLGRQAYRRH